MQDNYTNIIIFKALIKVNGDIKKDWWKDSKEKKFRPYTNICIQESSFILKNIIKIKRSIF